VGLVLAALMGMVGACGDSGDPPENDIDLTPPEPLPDVADIEEDTNDASDAGSDMGDLAEDTDDQDGGDAQDMGSDGDTGPELCGGEECGPQEMCENDVCKLPASVQCNGATDKGSVAVGETITLSGDFTGDIGDGLTTSCSGDRPEKPEMVYSFTVEENSLFEMTTDFPGAFDAKVEFRRSSCENPAADKTVCRDDDTGFWAAAGETVYAVVEHDSGPADSFTVDLTAKAAPCNPDTSSCNGQGNLNYCDFNSGNISEVEYQCPAGCQNGACTGDSCSDPIVVTGNGGTYQGDLQAYTDDMDFDDATRCRISDPQPPTEGAELVFEVALQAGETVSVDASNDSADNLIFISSSCGADVSNFACFEATNNETESMTAPEATTVYVIVDKWTRKIEPFDIRIDVN
jgi:hypothetical protein